MTFLPIAIFLPFVAAASIPLLHRWMGKRVGWAVSIVPLVLFIGFLSFLGRLGMDGVSYSASWVPLLGVDLAFHLNGLGLLFALLISGVGWLVAVYSIAYLDEREDLSKFYVYLLLFMGAMVGVVLADNLLLLYVFWELTSVSSFLLIGFWNREEASRMGALKALLITVVGGFAILVAAVLLYVAAGSFEFPRIFEAKALIHASPFYAPIVILLLLGAFTKSAQVPFHIWLPSAMAAPTPVSAYLHSATMVKAGIFLVAKFSPVFGGAPLWYYAVAGVGALTMFLGALLALRQTDLKALLAFSTVSQLGLIMPMFAAGTDLAALAGSAHIVHHATFKGALFMLVGVIDHQTRTRDLRRLSGLRKAMPVTAALMGIAALSMAGVWPLNGFVSKELIFEALLQPPFGPNGWTRLFAALTVAGSVLTTVYSLVLAHRIHFGEPACGDVDQTSDPPKGMLLAPAALTIFVVALGVYPQLLEGSLYRAAAGSAIGRAVQAQLHAVPVLGAPLMMSALALGAGALVYLRFDVVREAIGRLRPRFHANAVYEASLVALDRFSVLVTNAHMTGLLRDYLVFILAAFGAAVLYTIGRYGLHSGLSLDWAPIDIWEGAILAAIVVAAITAVVARRRLVAIVALGMVGAMMSLLYVMLRAPDLALTQLMVEAVTTVLLLLAFARLPAFKSERSSTVHQGINLAVAIGSGTLVSLVAIVAHGTRLFPSISSYFVEHSLDLGGGRNIVNVILVDFRGFDTMGEITVLAIAGLSVFALIRLKRNGRQS